MMNHVESKGGANEDGRGQAPEVLEVPGGVYCRALPFFFFLFGCIQQINPSIYIWSV